MSRRGVCTPSASSRSEPRRHRAGLLAVSLLLAGLCAATVLVAASNYTALAAPSPVADLSGGAVSGIVTTARRPSRWATYARRLCTERAPCHGRVS
jgi:hypothetical protein